MTLTKESEDLLGQPAWTPGQLKYLRTRLAAIESAVRAEQAAEVERLTALVVEARNLIENVEWEGDHYIDRVQGWMGLADAALAATPVAPAPNSAPNPPAPHRCRECDDGPNLSFPEPTHAPPAPGERCDSCNGTRWVDDENASPSFPGAWRHGRRPSDGLIPCGACNEGGWDAPWPPEPAPGERRCACGERYGAHGPAGIRHPFEAQR